MTTVSLIEDFSDVGIYIEDGSIRLYAYHKSLGHLRMTISLNINETTNANSFHLSPLRLDAKPITWQPLSRENFETLTEYQKPFAELFLPNE